MRRKLFQVILAGCLLTAGGGMCTASFAELSPGFIDSTNAVIDTLRKRECTLTVQSRGELLPGKEIVIRQLRNHFGFGAATPKKPFFMEEIDSAALGKAFRTYFEWVTPENEMKWKYTDEMDDYQNYEDADWLIDWCTANDIKVRGHSLFWNEHEGWIPDWSKELDTSLFKAAMKRRITGAMTHFKGKVAHWDIINEIVHRDSGYIAVPGMLANRSGDTTVFQWIFKEARKIDPEVKMAVNEYNIIVNQQWSAAKEYITEIKHIESDDSVRIDIVGLEGHFGEEMERSIYLERIDTVANALPGKELWLTEVDFSIDTLVRAEKMEELMRSCFAHPRIGGLLLWVWWEGNRWRPYTSFLVDSNFTENELGARWREVRNEWRTNIGGTTSAEGTFGFRGFHGKYEVSVYIADSVFTDTFYLDPGEGVLGVEVTCDTGTGIAAQKRGGFHTVFFRLNGKPIQMALSSADERRLFLFTYSMTGRLLSKTPLRIGSGIDPVSHCSAGCRIFRINTADRTLYTGMGLQLR
ncbi:MAG: endo-1,4-beta-xylanase [Chitinispirillaceae bacterium]|nr:endo-1,4-beta-xylanase [Chitinispirillaceae bacterium]